MHTPIVPDQPMEWHQRAILSETLSKSQPKQAITGDYDVPDLNQMMN